MIRGGDWNEAKENTCRKHLEKIRIRIDSNTDAHIFTQTENNHRYV